MFKYVFCALLVLSQYTLWSDDVYEPNNGIDNAAELTSTGTFNLSAEDDDWFKVVLSPGMVYLSMTPAGGVDLNMTLYNSAGQVIKAQWSSGTESFQYHIAVAGDYFINVAQTSVLTTTYDLTYSHKLDLDDDDSYEGLTENDVIDDAVELSGVEHVIENLKSFDDDWFVLELHPGELYVDILFDVNDGDIKLELYDSDFTRVEDSVNEDADSEGRSIQYEVTTSGKYYVVAYGETGNTYSLGVISDTVWMTILEYGPIRDVSTILFDIDDDGVDEIFVATSKGLDDSYNETLPAALLCLEHDGTLKWAREFPAMNTVDPQTNILYNTTSVSSAPVFADIDGDGEVEIIVGVGGDTTTGIVDVVGQPGDKGGVYALEADGSIKWFHESEDIIGGTENVGDGRPDGVYGSAVVFDLDSDGDKEVIYGGWDQRLWVLDGVTGEVDNISWPVELLDTIWATPLVTDLNGDGGFNILMNADITENTDALTSTGGIFHVLDEAGNQDVSGFDEFIGNPNYTTLKGKYEEQVLWSSPVVGDLDGDGDLEIAYGTGNFFKDTRGSYIRVWNHDGTEKFQLTTQGRTFATPLFCDLDNDGDLEIVTTTLEGYVYAWDHKGNVLFSTQTTSFGGSIGEPIFSSPLAVDLDEDDKLEVVYSQGSQVIIVDYQGDQLSDANVREMVFESYKGSPAIKDVDADGRLDIFSGGTTSDGKASVYRWTYEMYTDSANPRFARRQFVESQEDVEAFVERFYVEVLGREAEALGKNYWADRMLTGLASGAEVARGFILSAEFTNRGLTDDDYVDVLYSSFFDRSPDTDGKNGWLTKLSGGAIRSSVLDGFIFSQEFANLANRYGVLASKPDNQNVIQIEEFVQRFYQQILDREADTSGLEDWSYQLINQTRTGADISRGFINSSEFSNRNVDDATYLIILYNAFFARSPDEAGYNDWLTQLGEGVSRDEVLNGFLGAVEFANLSELYGIQAF